MTDKIDYVIVIFRNYDLLDIQRELFDRNEFNQVVGMHYFAGSHFRLNENIKSEFKRLCGDYV